MQAQLIASIFNLNDRIWILVVRILTMPCGWLLLLPLFFGFSKFVYELFHLGPQPTLRRLTPEEMDALRRKRLDERLENVVLFHGRAS